MTDTFEATTVDYPPAPWQLTGQLYGSLWLVPQASFREELPAQFEPVVNLGRLAVFAGFVDYQPGSVLTYHELLAGVLVHLKGSWRVAMHVTHIWVDSIPSLHGGRALWGVPKELANFDFKYARRQRYFKGLATDSKSGPLAFGTFDAMLGMPFDVPFLTPFPNLQILHGKTYATAAAYLSNGHFCRGGLRIPAQSPLASLGISDRRPLTSFAGLNFKMKLEAAKPIEKAIRKQ